MDGRDEGGDEPEGGLAFFVVEGEDGEDRAWDAAEEGEEVEGFLGGAAAVVDRGAFVEEEEGECEEGGEGVGGEDEEWGRGHVKADCKRELHKKEVRSLGSTFEDVLSENFKLCFALQ